MLCAELQREVLRLTDTGALDEQTRLREQLVEAVEALVRHVTQSLEADRDLDVVQHIRRARSSLTMVRDGLQAALIRKCVSEAALREAREVLGRLYPALNSVLVSTVNFRSQTPVR